jgi:cytochrome b involved in lipid metabolism
MAMFQSRRPRPAMAPRPGSASRGGPSGGTGGRTQGEVEAELGRIDAQIAGLVSQLQQQQRDSLRVDQQRLDRFEDITQQLQDQISNQTEFNKLTDRQKTSYTKLLADSQKYLARQKAINEKFKDGSTILTDMLLSAGGLVDEIDKFIDYLPGGKTLTRLFGITDLKESLNDAVDKGLEALGDALQDPDVSKFEAVQKAIGAFTKSLGSSKLLLVGMIAAIGALMLLAASMEKQFAAIAKETGITVAQSEALVLSSQEVANQLDNQLLSLKDVLAVQKATIKEFGTMAMITPEIAAEVANIGEAFGYGAEEAAKVNNALLGLGVPAAEAADAQRELAAEALKAGVNVGTVTADIATNAKATAKYFNGNVKSLTKAAVEAAKMGVSLADMVKISDSLLDIESSLANQFEFMALTGKEVNFDLARQLALQGDIAGATKSILEQMGGIDEFNQMDVLQKEAAAKAAGMSVDELSKSLAIQAALGNATEDQLAAAQGLGLSAAELQDMSKEDLEARLEQEQTAKRMSADMSDLGNELKTTLLPLGQDLLTIFAAISPVIKLIGLALKLALLPITTAVQGMKDIYNYFVEGKGELEFWKTTLAAFATILGVVKVTQFAITGLTAASAFFRKQETGSMLKNLALGIKEAAVAAGKAIAQITGMSATTLGAAAVTALAAGAAAAAFFSSAVPTGDMFSPADGRTQISTKEGGLFQLSKNDDVIAAPGLAGAMAGGGTTSTGGSTDMSTTNALLNQLVTNISALSNRPVQIVIGGRVVDEIKARADLNSTYVVGAG